MAFFKKNKEEKKRKPRSYDGAVSLFNTIFKNKDYKIEKKEVTKEDKKAAIITACIIIGVALLLWFLPFTHKFFEDFITLKF